jgi:hypothetical protein
MTPMIHRPGKEFESTRKIKKIAKIIKKLILAFNTTIIGRQILGKLIFFIRLALSKNTFTAFNVVSAKKLQKIIPTHKNML